VDRPRDRNACLAFGYVIELEWQWSLPFWPCQNKPPSQKAADDSSRERMRLQFQRICYGRSGIPASILERPARVVLLLTLLRIRL
jgi:hypothetical protein